MINSDRELERYKAELRRQEQNWEAAFRQVLHSDTAAVQVGLVALRAAIFINAGALVAVLAFVAQLWNKDGATTAAVLSASIPFVPGVAAPAMAAGVAYFYQSFVTAKRHHDLKKISEMSEALKPIVWTPRLIRLTGVAMIVLVFAGYACFIWGALRVLFALPV